MTAAKGIHWEEHCGRAEVRRPVLITRTGLLQDPHENSTSELGFYSLQLSFHTRVFGFEKETEPTIPNYVIKHAKSTCSNLKEIFVPQFVTCSQQYYSQQPRGGSNPNAH